MGILQFLRTYRSIFAIAIRIGLVGLLVPMSILSFLYLIPAGNKMYNRIQDIRKKKEFLTDRNGYRIIDKEGNAVYVDRNTKNKNVQQEKTQEQTSGQKAGVKSETVNSSRETVKEKKAFSFKELFAKKFQVDENGFAIVGFKESPEGKMYVDCPSVFEKDLRAALSSAGYENVVISRGKEYRDICLPEDFLKWDKETGSIRKPEQVAKEEAIDLQEQDAKEEAAVRKEEPPKQSIYNDIKEVIQLCNSSPVANKNRMMNAFTMKTTDTSVTLYYSINPIATLQAKPDNNYSIKLMPTEFKTTDDKQRLEALQKIGDIFNIEDDSNRIKATGILFNSLCSSEINISAYKENEKMIRNLKEQKNVALMPHLKNNNVSQVKI